MSPTGGRTNTRSTCSGDAALQEALAGYSASAAAPNRSRTTTEEQRSTAAGVAPSPASLPAQMCKCIWFKVLKNAFIESEAEEDSDSSEDEEDEFEMEERGQKNTFAESDTEEC